MMTTPSQAARQAGATGPDPARSAFDILKQRIQGVRPTDAAGFDRELNDEVFMAALKPIADTWFRLEVRGIENIPIEGAALIAGNHSGAIALDALMTQFAVFDRHPQHRHVHMLAADFVFEMPLISDIARAAGHRHANQDEAMKLLSEGRLVGVWPEGVAGVGKTWSKRYQLQQFGKGGFVATASAAHVPLIPVAIVGAEEAYPMIADFEPLAKLFGVPYFPITPTFPFFGLFGAVPLPSKWIIEFGTPIHPTDLPSPYDEHAVLEASQAFRMRVQNMVDKLLVQRGSAF
jgi:1-acyl-sn-glycerol-3-phosphate acyltransferase